MTSDAGMGFRTSAREQQQRFDEIRAALHAQKVNWAEMGTMTSTLSDSINEMVTLSLEKGMASTTPPCSPR